MTITPENATTPRRTHRPKQPENALPDPALKPRYCCAHSKGEPADAPHRVIVVDSVRFDAVRGDQRIYYYNEANGRRGSSLYESFKSGAEFWPAPPVVVEKPADTQPVAAVHTVATAPASHPTSQLPLTLAVHPVDGARALALLERLTVAAEAVARYVTTDCAAREPTAPTIAKPANANAA